MIISVWRYSHLALAISSFLLLTIASITGIFLAFEPVIEKAKNFHANSFDTITLSQAVPLLKEKYPGIQEVSVDDNRFVIIKYTEESGGDKLAYVDPATGKILGTPQTQKPFFQWMTALHRSLFIHETGRVLMGITSFLLILIAVSGIFLIVQRQNGWRYFFSNIEKTGFAQYYHALFGRISLFFILAVALTGTYIAVHRFVPAPAKASSKIVEENIKEEPTLNLNEFTTFQKTPLSSLQKLQYPFSDFPEDYYNVQLKDRELCINQFTGDVLAEVPYSKTYQLANFSLRWHTGRSGSIWAIILAITSAYILFFIYSGFAITLKRRRSRSKNKFKAANAEVIILVGSENGSTFKFADAVYKQLLKHEKKVFITDLSNYEVYPNATHLVIMASTYGQGDAPSNSKRFIEKIKQYPQQQKINYSILGFGSRSYSHFCKFAYDVAALLKQEDWAVEQVSLSTVNEKSPQDFSEWLTAWTTATGFKMMMPRELLTPKVEDLKMVKVTSKTPTDQDRAFIIRMKSRQLSHAVSGDLLAIYPKNDHRERLYSIGKVNGEIQLSVKLHEHGLGSAYLHALQVGTKFKAKLIKNQHFRFPKTAKQLVMISNGTGIAPFLGMISENKNKIPIQLYCGFRSADSFKLYQPLLHEYQQAGYIQAIHLSLSREGKKEYVSDRLKIESDGVLQIIQNDGVIMICGSLSMQKDVMNVLEEICDEKEGNILKLIEDDKILTDCY